MSKTTVAIKQDIRKKVKKLASILDVSQGEVIERAVNMFENSILSQFGKNKALEADLTTEKIDINKILEDATQKIWARDPEVKAIQEKLQTGPETIDDFIITNWNSGLE